MTEVVLDVVGNTLAGDMLANVVLSSKLDLPWFDFNDEPKEDSICIVGGAPSLIDMFPYLQARYKNGSKVWAVNGSFDWLTERNIIPHAHVMLDARPENIRFVNNPDKDTDYYLASQCDPSIFEALKNSKVTLVHVNTEGVYELLENEKDRPTHLLSGFTSVGMMAMVLAKLSGYKHIYLFGMDSSYKDGEHHVYSVTNNDNVIKARIHEQEFDTAPWMCQQARDFQNLAREFAQDDVIIEVCGSGTLLYAMAQAMTKPITTRI